jgi:hypothetical protein
MPSTVTSTRYARRSVSLSRRPGSGADWSRIRSLREHSRQDVTVPLGKLQRGQNLERPLTSLERIALAVASTQPTHHLTLGSANLSEPELAAAFGRLLPRIQRRKSRPKLPLIYFGAYAEGRGQGGCHLHLLLWERPYIPSYRAQARIEAIGNVHAVQVTNDPINTLRACRYVLGQQESVLGSRHHERHQARDKHQRRFVSNQARTLHEHHPELFRATQAAKDQSVSDKTLFASLPRFISST